MDAGLLGSAASWARVLEFFDIKGPGGRCCVQEPNPDRKKDRCGESWKCSSLRQWGQDIEKDMEVLKQWIKDKKAPNAVESSVPLVPCLECFECRALKHLPAAMLVRPRCPLLLILVRRRRRKLQRHGLMSV